MSRGNGVWAFGVVAVAVLLFIAGCGAVGPTTPVTTTADHPPKGPVKHLLNSAGGVSQTTVGGSVASVVHTSSSLSNHIDQHGVAQVGVNHPASAAIGKTGQSLQTAVQSKSIKPSEAELITPYVAEIDTLRGQYLAAVSALYNQARADYHSGKGSKLAIEGAYLPRLGALENSAQNQVNRVLFTLRAKLQANGYSSDEVNVLRSDYYSEVQRMMATMRK